MNAHMPGRRGKYRSSDAMKIVSINPATGEINKEFETVSAAEALDIAKTVKASFGEWKSCGLEARLERIRKLASVMQNRKEEYAGMITTEMGKTLADAIKEIEGCVRICNTTVDNAPAWLADERIRTEYGKSYVTFEPVGLVLAIMPWNYPFSQVIRCVVPALATGNVVLLKHSNSVPMCATTIEAMFREAEFPDNVFRTILVEHTAIPKLIKSDFVDCVSLTGGGEAGKQVAKIAAGQIKKIVLELGGSNPFIVLSDCDIDFASTKAVESRIAATGQTCSSSKRFIVIRKVADLFTRKVVERINSLSIGDPFDPKTNVGPLANAQQLAKIQEQVQDALAKGAKLECGGKKLDVPGNFYMPTVLTGVKKTMKVWKEEVFGPVLPIVSVRDENEAVALANATDYGLGASIWTKDVEGGEKLARRIDAGMACVNRLSNSDYRMPCGGTKRSGIGREFSRYGILEFTNIKSVIVA
jgi:acyl-CoA reductase-like NAD-dependent aldehyde dehydrogenase